MVVGSTLTTRVEEARALSGARILPIPRGTNTTSTLARVFSTMYLALSLMPPPSLSSLTLA